MRAVGIWPLLTDGKVVFRPKYVFLNMQYIRALSWAYCQVKQDGDAGRMCPRCNNRKLHTGAVLRSPSSSTAAVMSASSRTWFEFFWIPLIPFSKSHIWVCTICRKCKFGVSRAQTEDAEWEMKVGDGHDPQPPQGWNQRPQGQGMQAGGRLH